MHHHYASVIGWIVSLQKALVLNGKGKIHSNREELLSESTMKIRNMTGWALVLFFGASMQIFIHLSISIPIIVKLHHVHKLYGLY